MSESQDMTVELPLTKFVEQVAITAADRALTAHMDKCSIHKVERRVEKLETSKSWMIGFAAGASAVGGLFGGLLVAVVRMIFSA